MSDLLNISDLAVRYRTRSGHIDALHGIDLSVRAGEVTAVVGESGSGKSTTAQAVMGLLPTNAELVRGTITLGPDLRVGDQVSMDRPEDGAAVRATSSVLSDLGPREWRAVRGRQIGLIPQDPNNSLNPVKRIGETVSEALRIHRWKDRDARNRRVFELLERVGIDQPDLRARQYPHELSGGMKQRVLIAAAIALQPRLIIADEPTSALDVTVQQRILDLLDELRSQDGTGILFITHDLAVAGDRADQVVVMQHGEVREHGSAVQVLSNPQHAYTRQLLDDAPSFAHITEAVHWKRPAVTSLDSSATAAADAPLLRVEHLRQEFGGGRGKEPFVAVDDVSFAVRAGTTHALVGESGSGKTTTGRSIAGFNAPTSGSILFDGSDILGLDRKARRQLRRDIQLVYQNPYSSLDPKQTIGDIIAEPLANFGIGDKASRRRSAAEQLDLVALPQDALERRPRELSGGQLQRVAIARALVLQPRLIVLDEAVSALDVTVQAQILRLLSKLQQELALTYVFISHDLAVVQQISDTVSVLSHGRQVEAGTTERIFAHPETEYTQQLIAAIPGRRLPFTKSVSRETLE
ncbi:ABC transporter ATP-binding protein [Pseudoclavibacter sp. CFCC 14310]|uniref:dipeptide ABC transporter ATP-binding protein n=1 Tax=Pseudoclavibacter sp. CFCC 14310 TaxID=2615180 RepID=UPI0013014A16|nr:ABC transporter ATP-binding protein [Pseudoclavibacter sp. CFCC 14310]KAB1647046.1 ABC transporter ATP-binding protein [Pseudoclavibacter sp. CFCC 14310]